MSYYSASKKCKSIPQRWSSNKTSKLFLRTGIIFFCTEKRNARIGMNADLTDKDVLELSDLFKVKKKSDYQFPRLSPYHGFCCIFPYCGEFIGKPIHFPYAEVCHRMGIGWEKSTHTMGKVWLSISQTFPIPWVLLHFPVLWENYGETHALPIWWHRLIFSCVSYENKILSSEFADVKKGTTQLTCTCSNSTIETLENDVKYIQR